MKRQKIRKPKRIEEIDMDDIARKEGFPHFLKKLEGFGNYVAYEDKNREVIRVYNPRTGKKVHEYRPKDASPTFRNPEPVIQILSSMMTTTYSRRAQEKYSK